MRRTSLAAMIVVLGGCRHERPAAAPAPPPAAAPPLAAAPFDAFEVATANGLSGLALDADGTLWTVAERAQTAYRITLDGPTADATPVPIEGVPVGIDLEAIAVLGGGRIAFGTESKASTATVLVGEQRGATIAIVQTISLSTEDIGIPAASNQGIEGLCGQGDTLVAALEASGSEGGRRYAALVWIEHGQVTHARRLWLTSETGKISALECDLDAGTAWAVERHFEVTRILGFDLARGEDAPITPAILVDLTAEVASSRNLEGITRVPDGRLAVVVDNQWRTITGPNELLLLRLR